RRVLTIDSCCHLGGRLRRRSAGVPRGSPAWMSRHHRLEELRDLGVLPLVLRRADAGTGKVPHRLAVVDRDVANVRDVPIATPAITYVWKKQQDGSWTLTSRLRI